MTVAMRTRTLTTGAAIAALLTSLFPIFPVSAATDYRELLQGGKEHFVAQCLNCHQTVDEAAGGFRTRSGWEKVVADMVARGARLDAAQQASVVEYLSARMLLVSRCRGCHSYFRPLAARKSPEDWKRTVERMAAQMPRATGMTPEDIDRLAVFLSVERPLR